MWRVPGKDQPEPSPNPPRGRGGHHHPHSPEGEPSPGSHREHGHSPEGKHSSGSHKEQDETWPRDKKYQEPTGSPHQPASDSEKGGPGPNEGPRNNHWHDKDQVAETSPRPKDPEPDQAKHRHRRHSRRKRSRSKQSRKDPSKFILWLQGISPKRYHQACGLVFFGFLFLCWLLTWQYEAWWPATIFLFAPRVLLVIPWLVLILFGFWLPSWLGWTTLFAAVIPLWALMGFNIPQGALAKPTENDKPIRVMTCNMHSCRFDPPSLEGFIQDQEPQVVVLQNWDVAKNSLLAHQPDWKVHHSRAHFLASRFPITLSQEIGEDSRGEQASAMRYDLETPQGMISVFSLHMATNRDGFQRLVKGAETESIQDNSNRRLRQARYLDTMVKRVKGPAIVMGDFNTPRESPHFQLTWSGLRDAHTLAGWGLGYTFYGDGTMVRIDHILTTSHWEVSSCRVGPFVGSPHRPVVADLHWTDRNENGKAQN